MNLLKLGEMMYHRFGRDYEIIVTTKNGEVIKISPNIRIQFEATKSVKGGLNSCRVSIYNLNETNRRHLVKDKTDQKTMMPFLLQAGYEKIETIFQGTITESYSERRGADIITTLVCHDGGHDFLTSYTSKTVKSNDIEYILEDMPNIKKGKVTKRVKLHRPKVLVGSSFKIIEDMLKEDETVFIDNEKLHILKDNEITDDLSVIVSPETGLLKTPSKKESEVTFQTMMNPSLKISGLCEIQSTISKELNGVYKVNTIKYSGDTDGADWKQEVSCSLSEKYEVVK